MFDSRRLLTGFAVLEYIFGVYIIEYKINPHTKIWCGGKCFNHPNDNEGERRDLSLRPMSEAFKQPRPLSP